MAKFSLALYLGESYAEIELRNSESEEAHVHKNFFLPQTSLKSILTNHIKTYLTAYDEETKETSTVENVYIVSQYFDRLKPFRLGGSVIQILDENQENNYVFENSNKLSLAAQALIISLKQDFTMSDLSAEVERIKKINVEIKKVVISLKTIQPQQLEEVEIFLKEKGMTVFINSNPLSMPDLRKTLINAGIEGTKEEIIKDTKEMLGQQAEVYFWIKDQFTQNFENIDLFFSADTFLQILCRGLRRDILIHTDLDRWVSIKPKNVSSWNSPWGRINHEHPLVENLGLQPFSEVYINGSGHLSFSKQPAPIEPGPMLAGRSVKPLIIDAFYERILENEDVSEMFNQLRNGIAGPKIEAQFKVLEKGQIHYDDPFSLQIVQDFIVNKLGYDILLVKLKEENLELTGQLNFLFEKLFTEVNSFSWTHHMFMRRE